MTEWPESRRLASLYQSPGPAGIGFARYASSAVVTPELWENITYTENEALRRPEDPAVEGWADDMEALREALEAEGVTEKRKVKLEISFTEVIPRSVRLEAELDVTDIEDLEAGYGFDDRKYAKLVQDKLSTKEDRIEMLHDEVDHIEILDPDDDVDDAEEGIEEPLDRAELREMVQAALNSGKGDTEWATLVDLGGILGLEYDEEKDTYQ
jgi:hypothetical protein